ncbi:DUF1848 domain-containing protein [Desulfosarcina sp. OttesenSCG-928-G10]|nr:DUF1848 domain-containing protein [Desulfosarcina sp. OttesenSCG-928-G10]MDL2322195.1 DUF1848 domain-containing protein [Desulfosarcina sp. OttesenSCG-928-B08]
MIISASRRTDIPAFYSDWLLRRLEEKYVFVPNPWNPKQAGTVRLTPENVDCIMFWTKNPEPMLDKLAKLDALGYRYYFSFTVTAYGPNIETALPPKARIIETFRRLSDRLGPARVDWRFDPIMVHGNYSIQWHLERFDELCALLSGHTERCIINFVKFYRHIASRITLMDADAIRKTALGLAEVAAARRMPLYNCTEQWDLREQGIGFSACIDRKKIESLTGWPIAARKDPGQPAICNCLESVDIGMYGTCPHGCTYCYATKNDGTVRRRMAAHDPASPMLTGWPTGTERVTDRTRPSLRDPQLRLG